MPVQHLAAGPNTIAGPADDAVPCQEVAYSLFPNTFPNAGNYVITVRNKGGTSRCSITILSFNSGTPAAPGTPAVPPAAKPGISASVPAGGSVALPDTLNHNDSFRVQCVVAQGKSGCEFEWMVNRIP
jgi:hypothetical protein